MSPLVRTAVLVLTVLILGRAWLAIDLPLTDTTEARYGEIARKMVETSDWITPQHRYGVPFWGKPPLAIWFSAAGIELLGATELAPRLPILVLSVGFLALFFAWLKEQVGVPAAATSAVILASSLLFFVSMAAVMTDMVLTICVGLALIAFWLRYHGGSWQWEALMYAAIGLGVLTKGPLAGVLTLGPIGLWSVLLARVSIVWRRFAWLRGLLLVAAVSLPWYIAAELKTPGFLRYFIIGEHFGRFLIPGWAGDLYGNAHDEPIGMIWVFFFAGMLPWSLLFLPVPFMRRKVFSSNWVARRDLIVFGLSWALIPLLLFTASANIISPYALPAAPGAVIAAAAAYAMPAQRGRSLSILLWLAAACMLIPALWLDERMRTDVTFAADHSQKAVVDSIVQAHPEGCSIYYWNERWFSGEYYSGGNAREIREATLLGSALDGGNAVCIVVRANEPDTLPAELHSRLSPTLRVGNFTVLEPASDSSAESRIVPNP